TRSPGGARPARSTLLPYTTLFRSYGLLQQYVSPAEFGLFLAINYVAMVIIGGLGTIFGSVLGALVVWGGRSLIDQNSSHAVVDRSEEHTSELQSRENLVCRRLLEN